ncbi:hypothetical protein RRF57_008787 [Xylaria bambusicola]|uniref:RNA polymerase III subunit Rpc25 domain-containing protein n=1 Tax=Xylaria bambusicola TaxID=326684 RepID=A0AAN7UNM1_9PEZI
MLPFKGETLFGTISSANPEGLKIRTDFFEEIFEWFGIVICLSDHNEKAWVWVVDEDRMHYDKNEMVRFQVLDETWNDQLPDSGGQEALDRARSISPYALKGSMFKEGLGVCLWW